MYHANVRQRRVKSWALLASWCVPFTVVAAESPVQEHMTLRGKEMAVWPVADIRARGFDLPDLPHDQNAFYTYVEAINLYKTPPSDLQTAFDYAVEHAWPTEVGDKLSAFVLDEDNQAALRIAKQASVMPNCQMVYFGDPRNSIISLLLPSLSDFRYLGKLLAVDGRRLEEQGDYAAALENYATIYRMGHHVGDGITLIESLVSLAMWSTADRAVQQLVLRRDLTKAQLDDVIDKLVDIDPLGNVVAKGIRAERVLGPSVVDELTASPLRFFSAASIFNGGGGEIPLKGSDGWASLAQRSGKLAIPDRTIKAHMHAFYDLLIEKASQPAHEAQWNTFDDSKLIQAVPAWDFLSRMLLPSLSRAGVIGERGRMQSNATHVAVALRRYAAEHDGAAPARLDEVSDWVAPDDLVDPFTGRVFAYEHHGDAWQFHGVSENYADDGGKIGKNAFDLDYVVQYPPTAVEPFNPNAVAE